MYANVYANVKAAEKAEHAAMQLIAEQQANAVTVAEVAPIAADAPMDIDGAQPTASATGTKRKAEDEVVPEETKKPKMGKLSRKLSNELLLTPTTRTKVRAAETVRLKCLSIHALPFS